MLLFSDESEIYSGLNSGLISTFDINTMKSKNSYSGHSSPITSLSIYRQNNTNCVLSSADAQGKIKLWDLKSKNPAVNYKGHFASINCVKFSPDMTCLASGDEDGYVKIWDLRNGKIMKEINNFKSVISLEFNPDEIGLAVSYKDKIVRYYNLKNYEIVTETNSDKIQIEKIVFDKKNFVFLATNDNLKYYEMTAHKMLLHNTFETGWKKLQSVIYVKDKYFSGLSVMNYNIQYFYLRYYDLFKGKKISDSFMSNIDEEDDENVNDDDDNFGVKENNFLVVNNNKKKKNKKIRANSVKSKISNKNDNNNKDFVYSNKILKDILNDENDDSDDFENKKNDFSLGISKFINSNMTDATVSNEKKDESVFIKNAKNILGIQNNNYSKNLEKFIKNKNNNNKNKNNNKNNKNNNNNLLPLNISNITLTTQNENNNDDIIDFIPDKNTHDLIKNLSKSNNNSTNSNTSNNNINNNNNISEEKNLLDFINSDKSKEIDSISIIDNINEIDDPFLEDPIFTSTKRSKNNNNNNTLNESNFTLSDFNNNNNNNNNLNNTNTTFKTINSNETLGLDIDNFMNNSKLTISSTTTAQNQMNFNQTIHEIPKSKDLPILTEINSQHDKIRKEITKRKNHLINIISAWNDSDMFSVIKSLQKAHDLSVINDFFTYAFVGRNDIAKIPISLEQSLILLPYVKNLINNQYNAYNITGCKTGMIFIKILFEIVVTTKQNLNSNLKGLDVFEKLDADFEEKVNKCDEIIKIFKEMEENKKLKKLSLENKKVVSEAAKNFLSELEFFLQPFKYQNYNESSNKIHIKPEF